MSSDDFELASKLFGAQRTEESGGNEVSVIYGTAVSDSVDGLVGVLIDGNTTTDEDGDSVIELPTSPPVKSGDEVMIALLGGVGRSPVVLANMGSGDTTLSQAEEARAISEKALSELAEIQHDHYYVYHGENDDALTVDEETTVVAIRFGTVSDTRVAVNFTVEHDMSLDGNVIARIYVNDTRVKELRVYEQRGNALLDFMWSSEFMGDASFDIRLTLQPEAATSQMRELDARTKALWDRLKGTNRVTWDELAGKTWDELAAETWYDVLYREVEPSTAQPVIAIGRGQAQGALFGGGLLPIESWNGRENIDETVPLLSLVQPGLSIGYSATAESALGTPRSAGFEDAIGLSLMRAGIAFGYADAIGFGEDMETVWADDLVYDSLAVIASGGTWSAAGAATVETVDLGTDRTVDGVSSVSVASSGEIAFSASFDGGETWLAYDGGAWADGTMGADELNAIADWPDPPLRFRMVMGAGASVNGMMITYERS